MKLIFRFFKNDILYKYISAPCPSTNRIRCKRAARHDGYRPGGDVQSGNTAFNIKIEVLTGNSIP